MHFENAILDPSILASKRRCKILSNSGTPKLFVSKYFLNSLKNGNEDIISSFSNYLSKDSVSSTDMILNTIEKTDIKSFDWRDNVNKLDKLTGINGFKDFKSIVSIIKKIERPIDEIWKDNLVFMLTSSPMLSRLKNSAKKVAGLLNKILIHTTENMPIIDIEKHLPHNLKVYVKSVKRYSTFVCLIVSVSGFTAREVSLSLAFPIIEAIRLLIVDP